MKTIVLASNNKNKIEEFREMFSSYNILSLKDIGFEDDIVEDGETFEDNAKIKTNAVYDYCKQKGFDYAVLADDSGLCVDALDGAPGVFSARYSGDHNDEGNRQKVLKELADKTNRNANMTCVLCFKDSAGEKIFKGQCFGKITNEKIGNDKFGYDPIFYSNDLKKTFGQVSKEEKDSVSHRGRAVNLLKEYLEK